jgi:hypothetical protein
MQWRWKQWSMQWRWKQWSMQWRWEQWSMQWRWGQWSMQWRCGQWTSIACSAHEVTEGLRNVRSLTWKRTKLPLWQSMMFPSVSSRGSLLLRVTVVARDCGTALTETSADNATTTRIADIVFEKEPTEK